MPKKKSKAKFNRRSSHDAIVNTPEQRIRQLLEVVRARSSTAGKEVLRLPLNKDEMITVESGPSENEVLQTLASEFEARRSTLKINASKAVEARKANAEERRKTCRDLASTHVGRRSITQAASQIRKKISDEKMLRKLPSHSAIMADIRDLFHDRVRKTRD